MAAYFLDSSAIVKHYVPAEQGHNWVTALFDPVQGNNLHSSQAAFVEVVATICRKTREQHITIPERERIISTFRQDIKDICIVRIVTTDMYTVAGNLCRLHPLRAYDAVQLACILDLREETSSYQVSDPIYVCADNNLLTIAAVEGLSVDNPNNYS